MTTTMEAPRRLVPLGRIWRVGLLAAIVAAAGNALIYEMARALGVSLVMPLQPGAPPALLPVGMVILMSVVGAVAGTVAFTVLGRIGPRGTRVFQVVGLVILLLSFGAPLSLGAADGATKITLVLMHMVAGGSIIGLLSRRGPRQVAGDRP